MTGSGFQGGIAANRTAGTLEGTKGIGTVVDLAGKSARVLCMLAAITTGPAFDAPTRAAFVPPPAPVLCEGVKIGTVDVTTYGVFYDVGAMPGDHDPGISHAPPRLPRDSAGGAKFSAVFNFEGCPPGEFLREGTTFNWVQIVYTDSPANNPVRGVAPTTGYVDPWSPPGGGNGPAGDGYEDQKPFYWTDAQLANVGQGGDPARTNTLLFSDYSTRSFTDAGVSWTAELNLVCTWDNQVHSLGYFDWGWTMPAMMLADPSREITLNPPRAVWNDGPSPGLAKLALASEFGGARGWMVTDEPCCISALPGPSSSILLGLGIVATLACRCRPRDRMAA
jgi:hypothetical protein